MSEDRQPLFSLRNVRKGFGAEHVLRDISFDVYKGEVLALLGPSGCGKSLLLKMMIGLVLPDAGEILFEGRAVNSLALADKIELRRRVGMVFQYGALFDSMSVRDNVVYGLREHYAKTMPEEQKQQRVRSALEAVSLLGIEDLLPSALSGGMKKRVGIARTVAVQPEVVLYDEPTMGLDPISTTRVGQLIRNLAHETKITSVMVTHDMKLAFDEADRVLVISEGLVLGQGTPKQIQEHHDLRVRGFIEGRDPDWTEEDVQMYGVP
ncbi:MAG: ATP-binding cassette domain-containing protein [Deltaproteobacteria bacterium]|nr:ATP-binding cassette domain-containing protein [Deltaproteobacteria bacterium]